MMLEISESEKGPTNKEWLTFRNEVEALYRAELSVSEGESRTGHFSDPYEKKEAFNLDDLEERDFRLWKAFKSCQSGDKTIQSCLEVLSDYRKSPDPDGSSLAARGLISYISNQLTVMRAFDQLESRKKDR